MAAPLPDVRQLVLARALDRSEPLAGLLQRVQGSRQRFEAIRPMLPPALVGSVRPGALDETAWLVLVDHAAAAAKLRQMQPALQTALAEAGWPAPQIKIKILPRA